MRVANILLVIVALVSLRAYAEPHSDFPKGSPPPTRNEPPGVNPFTQVDVCRPSRPTDFLSALSVDGGRARLDLVDDKTGKKIRIDFPVTLLGKREELEGMMKQFRELAPGNAAARPATKPHDKIDLALKQEDGQLKVVPAEEVKTAAAPPVAAPASAVGAGATTAPPLPVLTPNEAGRVVGELMRFLQGQMGTNDRLRELYQRASEIQRRITGGRFDREMHQALIAIVQELRARGVNGPELDRFSGIMKVPPPAAPSSAPARSPTAPKSPPPPPSGPSPFDPPGGAGNPGVNPLPPGSGGLDPNQFLDAGRPSGL